jgi:hypothetical protein
LRTIYCQPDTSRHAPEHAANHTAGRAADGVQA